MRLLHLKYINETTYVAISAKAQLQKLDIQISRKVLMRNKIATVFISAR